MSQELYSFSELACGTGRFEMQPKGQQGVTHYEVLVEIADAERLGLFDAASIRACAPLTRSAKHRELLDALGDRAGSHWILRAPREDADRKRWAKLLKSDQVLVFSAPSDNWLAKIVSQLHSPFVAVLPSMSLTEDWLTFERESFRGGQEGVHVSLGAGRGTITFVGAGKLFSEAVAYAAQRPPLMIGYSPGAYRETLQSRALVFGC